MYSGQWLAVAGFLPSIYAQAGLASGATAWLTALAAAVNSIGNLAAGHAGHWQLTWTVTGACALVGMGLAWQIQGLLEREPS